MHTKAPTHPENPFHRTSEDEEEVVGDPKGDIYAVLTGCFRPRAMFGES